MSKKPKEKSGPNADRQFQPGLNDGTFLFTPHAALTANSVIHSLSQTHGIRIRYESSLVSPSTMIIPPDVLFVELRGVRPPKVAVGIGEKIKGLGWFSTDEAARLEKVLSQGLAKEQNEVALYDSVRFIRNTLDVKINGQPYPSSPITPLQGCLYSLVFILCGWVLFQILPSPRRVFRG